MMDSVESDGFYDGFCRDDAMDMETSEEDVERKITEILEFQNEFKETWKMLDEMTKYIAVDNKLNYENLNF